jgi:CRISPR/Cas system-associated exonuclease Cas4 (RecB family)
MIHSSLLISLLLIIASFLVRHRAGLGFGKTLTFDGLTLRSEKYGLVGRPDRIVKRGKSYIPEEKKFSASVQESHQIQLGVYLLLVEEYFNVRPPFGVIITRRGRVKVKNTTRLRAQVLGILDEIHRRRTSLGRPFEPAASPAMCRRCSQRENCTVRLA